MHADLEVKEAFLGRPVQTLDDEVDFWYRAGYEYVCLPIGVMYAEVVSTRLKRSDLGTAYEGKAHTAAWAEEGFGPLASEAGFRDFPWPDPDGVDLERYRKVPLRSGMQVIAYFGKIFTYTWMQMGMTGFAVALYENPRLVARVFEEFGRRHPAVFQRIVQLPDLGGVWIADDMAYSEGMLVSPDVLREHCLPWYRKMGGICRERVRPRKQQLRHLLRAPGKLQRHARGGLRVRALPHRGVGREGALQGEKAASESDRREEVRGRRFPPQRRTSGGAGPPAGVVSPCPCPRRRCDQAIRRPPAGARRPARSGRRRCSAGRAPEPPASAPSVPRRARSTGDSSLRCPGTAASR